MKSKSHGRRYRENLPVCEGQKLLKKIGIYLRKMRLPVLMKKRCPVLVLPSIKFQNIRPAKTPAKNATMPSMFWITTLSPARRYSESLIIPPVSSMNAENVVKAPRKPIKKTALVLPLIWRRYSHKDHRIPAIRQPSAFTASVPHGNSVPELRWTSPASAYLARVPSAPAIERSTIF